jgi:hypothetical protein
VVETPKHLPMLVKGSSEASEHQSSASVPQASSQ